MPRNEADMTRGHTPPKPPQKRVFLRPFEVQERPNGYAIVDANGIELMVSNATSNLSSFPQGLSLDEAQSVINYTAKLLNEAAAAREQQSREQEQRQQQPQQQARPQQQNRYRGGNGGNGYGNRNGGGNGYGKRNASHAQGRDYPPR